LGKVKLLRHVATRALVGFERKSLILWRPRLDGTRPCPASAFGLGQGAVTGSFNYKIGDLHRRITLDTTDMLTGEKARHGWTDPASGEPREGASQILADARSGIDYVVERAKRRKKQSLGARPRKPATKRSAGTWEDAWKPLHTFPLDSVGRDQVAAELNTLADRGPPPQIASEPHCRPSSHGR